MLRADKIRPATVCKYTLQIFFSSLRRWFLVAVVTKQCKQMPAILPQPRLPRRQPRGWSRGQGNGSGRGGHPGAARRKGKANSKKLSKSCWAIYTLGIAIGLPEPHGTDSISCLLDLIFASYSCFFLKWILLRCKTNFVPLLNKCWLLINTLPSLDKLHLQTDQI